MCFSEILDMLLFQTSLNQLVIQVVIIKCTFIIFFQEKNKFSGQIAPSRADPTNKSRRK